MRLLLFPFVLLLILLPFPGTVAARLLCLLLALVIAIQLSFRDKKLAVKFPPNRLGISIWMLIAMLSLLYSVDPAYSAKEIKNELLYAMIAFFGFYVVSQTVPAAQTLLRSVAFGFLLIGSVGVYGWISNRLVWPDTGIAGGIGSFSTYIITSMPALFWLSREDTSSLWRRFAKSMMAFAVGLALITVQRVTWPTLVAEFAIALVLLRREGLLLISKRMQYGFIAVAVIAGVLAVSVTNQIRGLGSIADLVPSTETFNVPIAKQSLHGGDVRLPFWPATISTIIDHPLTGAGFGQGAMKKAYPELIPPNISDLWHAHNVVLNYAIQMGVPGAFALLFMFFGLGRNYWRSLHNSKAATTAAIAGIMLIVGVLLRNQTNDFFRRDMALLFWCLTGIFSALVVRSEPEE